MDAASVRPPDPIEILSSYGLGKLDDAFGRGGQQASGAVPGLPETGRRDVGRQLPRPGPGRAGPAQVDPLRPSPTRRSVNAGKGSASSGLRPASTLPPGLADHPDYEILRELGRGGMGVVYLAQNKLMGRKEVLKVVSGHLINRRVSSSASSARSGRRPSCTTPTSSPPTRPSAQARASCLPWSTSRATTWPSWSRHNGPLPVAHACNFVHQAALGLQHAHENGHGAPRHQAGQPHARPPGEPRPVVKVLDFGLAKVTSEGQADSGLTREGQMLGTPDFIAPEQIRDAQSADIRADIYSLGCTLYYLLAGRPPFAGDNLWDLLPGAFLDGRRAAEPGAPGGAGGAGGAGGQDDGQGTSPAVPDPGRGGPSPHAVLQAGHGAVAWFECGGLANQSAGSPNPDFQSQPRADAAGGAASTPAAPGRKLLKTGTDGVAWESLIAIDEDEPLVDVVKPKPWEPKPAAADERVRRPTWVWPAVAVGVLVFGLFAALPSIVIKVKTQDGVIVLKNVPKDSEILVDGNTITFTWQGNGEPLEIRAVPGQHRVSVRMEGLTTLGEVVTVKAGESVEVTVRLDSLIGEPPGQEKANTVDLVSQTGYLPLFNGKDLDGWEKRPEYGGGDWRVINGVLEGGGSREGHATLVTKRRDFRDFRLRVTLMYKEALGTGHIQLRRSERSGKWNGYLVTSGAWWNRTDDGQQRKVPDQGTFPVIGSVAKIKEAYVYGPWDLLSKPIPYSQGWNVIEITALKNRISTKVNDITVSEYVDDLEPYVSGSIALVCNGTWNVRIRSVEIQEIPSDASGGSPVSAVNPSAGTPTEAPREHKTDELAARASALPGGPRTANRAGPNPIAS